MRNYKITVYLDEAVWQGVKERACREDRPISQVAARMIREALGGVTGAVALKPSVQAALRHAATGLVPTEDSEDETTLVTDPEAP